MNSIGDRADYVAACLDLWDKRARLAIFNVTNSGFVTTRQVIGFIERVLGGGKHFQYWANDEEFYRSAARTPRSNCVLDVSKLLATGVKIRPVGEALEHALQNWQPENA